jgi:predicted RNA-binding Zn ribbon-like protein
MEIRPLRGEPLGLDLVNTMWIWQGERLDQLGTPDGVAAWLADHGLSGEVEPLLEARAAIRDLLEGRGHERLNAVLDHGSMRPRMGAGGPYETVVLDDPRWEAAWLAAADAVRLLGERPERVKGCGNERCILWFLDVSKNGSRRWCSMEVCGNRAKVSRFNQRHTR